MLSAQAPSHPAQTARFLRPLPQRQASRQPGAPGPEMPPLRCCRVAQESAPMPSILKRCKSGNSRMSAGPAIFPLPAILFEDTVVAILFSFPHTSAFHFISPAHTTGLSNATKRDCRRKAQACSSAVHMWDHRQQPASCRASRASTIAKAFHSLHGRARAWHGPLRKSRRIKVRRS